MFMDTYGATISAASARSELLFAANCTSNGLSPNLQKRFLQVKCVFAKDYLIVICLLSAEPMFLILTRTFLTLI